MAVSTTALITVVAVFASLSSTYAKRGIIAMAPGYMASNSSNKIYLHFFEINSSGKCKIVLETVDLQPNKTKEIVARKTFNVKQGEKQKEVVLTFKEILNQYRLTIWLICNFRNGYKFSQQEIVYTERKRDTTLIFLQTDKPIYKPGDEMRFRVLVCDRNLKPSRNVKGDIYIENTMLQRVAQWKNVSFSKGIIQRKFSISDEPQLGRWQVQTDVSGRQKKVEFEVKEYVLPTIEVKIHTIPSYILADAKTILYQVCATYTYGKPVKGKVIISSSLERYYWSHEKLPTVIYKNKINGCIKYRLKVSLVDKDFQNYYRQIETNATVIEEGTGVMQNATIKVSRTDSPLTIDFPGNSYNQPFKPGMPYRGKMKATNPDKTPAAGEKFQICATLSRARILCQWWATRNVKYCSNFTTNKYGEAEFCVPPLKNDTTSLQITARYLKYGQVTSPNKPLARRRRIIYPPENSIYVKPYNSPSKNYLQIENDGDTLKCGRSTRIRILYTAKRGDKHILYYQVVSKGKVVLQRSKRITCTGEGDVAVSRCKKSTTVTDARTTLVPEDLGKGVPFYEDIDRNPRLICYTEVRLNITAKVSHHFSFLAYYIRPDKEVVADSAKFIVEKCFQNKVEFRFRDKIKQPADNTSYILKASRYSLCGTKVVDKSVTLLDSTSGEITTDQIFSELGRFEMQNVYRDHCNEDFRRGGKKAGAKFSDAAIYPPIIRPYSYSQELDALNAFESMGWIVFTDFYAFNRKCSKGEGVTENRPTAMHGKSSRMAAETDDMDAGMSAGGRGGASEATVSLVEKRYIFPETWLFSLVSVGKNGKIIRKVTLPHTITEWTGYAVCINAADGLGISERTNITSFQAIFASISFPNSAIIKEKIKCVITVFCYLKDKCLAMVTKHQTQEISDGETMSKTSGSKDFCLCGGDTFSYPIYVTPKNVGTLTVTVTAENSDDTSVCEDKEVADIKARDKIEKSIEVGPGGFSEKKVVTDIIALDDDDEFEKKYYVSIPDDAIPRSGKAYCSITGNILGISVSNINNQIPLPTGCGEQNIAAMKMNLLLLYYLTTTKQITPALKEKLLNHLRYGYYNQLNYKHGDGSYSAFGNSDNEGNMLITATTMEVYSGAAKYIFIDSKEIKEPRDWIIKKQESNGCFTSTGNLFSEGIKGKENNYSTTAHVLTCLLDSGYNNRTVIKAALRCINRDRYLQPYSASLYYLCAVLAESSGADRYKQYLDREKITEDDEVYWRNRNGSSSIDTETSGYVLRAVCLKRGKEGISEMVPIARNLTKAMNPTGGWSSSSDTAASLAGFVCFAKLLNDYRVNVIVELTAENLEETVIVAEGNKSLTQKNKIPKIPSTLKVYAKGTGYCLVQVTTYYSTNKPPYNKFFAPTIEVTIVPGNCKMAKLHICFGYVPIHFRSNMALMEVYMPTGFSSDRDSVKAVLDQSKAVKKYQFTYYSVRFYMIMYSEDRKCITFYIREDYSVEDRQKSFMEIYDYYNPHETRECVEYSVPDEC